MGGGRSSGCVDSGLDVELKRSAIGFGATCHYRWGRRREPLKGRRGACCKRLIAGVRACVRSPISVGSGNDGTVQYDFANQSTSELVASRFVPFAHAALIGWVRVLQ